MILQTERLFLREMKPADAEDMLRLHSNEQVQKYTGEEIITSIEGIHHKIREKMNDYKVYGFGRWATLLKEENKFVGWAGLAFLPEFDEIDLGYRLLPEYWGHGIATEVSRAILRYAFEDLQLDKVIAIAMKENKASIRVMEKVGMQFDKYAPYEPDGEDVAFYWCDKRLIAEHIRQNN